MGHTKGDLTTAITHNLPSNWAWLGKVAIPQDEWVHLVAVYTGKVVEHYVNGLKVAAYALDGDVVGTEGCRFAIGARKVGCSTPGQMLVGLADEVFVLGRALEKEEVAALTKQAWQGACQAAIQCTSVAQCDDANSCTKDSCDTKSGGCVHAKQPMGSGCDDGNACTTSDTCNTVSCQAGPAKKCDDANPCTKDSCNPKAGCETTKLKNGTDCGGGKTCTSGVCK